MEDMAKLGDLALKLERYKANIIHALSWVVFGMAFSGLITLANALVLLGYHWSVFWISPAIAGIVGADSYPKSTRKIGMLTVSSQGITESSG